MCLRFFICDVERNPAESGLRSCPVENGDGTPHQKAEKSAFLRKIVDKGAKCDMIIRQNRISGVEKDE